MSRTEETVGEVISVNVSAEKGTAKHPVEEIVIDACGVVGDAHAGTTGREISILGLESIERFSQTAGRKISPGEFAENITIRGIDLSVAALLDRFRVGEVELEVTQIGKTCHGADCAIFREVGQCVMPKEGVFCRVVKGGAVRSGDRVEHLPKVLTFKIITLSDRAYRGEYPDKSGPRIREMLEESLGGKRRVSFEDVLLPDDADRLLAELTKGRDSDTDAVFTTGGTGVGPRDMTPDVVAKFCDKLIPGIMENIRLKSAETNPNALLSRSVAGVAGSTLVYTLPGSVHAVEEYMVEILKTLEHLLLTVRGAILH